MGRKRTGSFRWTLPESGRFRVRLHLGGTAVRRPDFCHPWL